MVTADYYYPDCECVVDFFCNPRFKNCWHGRPGIEPKTLDPDSQPGAYDLSATATMWEMRLLQVILKYCLGSGTVITKKLTFSVISTEEHWR